LCNRLSEMKERRRFTITDLLWIAALVATAACRSAQPRQIPSTSGRQATREEESTLIHADSEVFAAVVRAQLDGGGDEYPYHLERVRYDARPYGTRSGYPEVFAGVQGIDPTLTFARAGESAIDQLIDNRKQILQMNGLESGGPYTYSQCAGARVPPPPPVRGSAARMKRADVHAGCPRTPEYYVTVGLPIRGQPEGLRNVRDTKGHRVAPGGDIWTALVDEHSAGPKGWTWSQYAWLFKRSRWSGRLELASTILIGVVE
jgi:hypothetical protein